MVDLANGRVRPAMASAPVLSSQGTAWKGIVLEQHASAPLQLAGTAPLQHAVTVQLTPSSPMEIQLGEEPSRIVQLRPGQVGIFPAMTPVHARTIDSGDFVAVTLENSFLAWAAHELADNPRIELTPKIGVDDPLLAGVILALRSELEAGNPSGRVYAESLASSAALHLVRHYSRSVSQPRAGAGGLGSQQLRTVIEYIHTHLAGEVSLKTLAGLANLSPFHFARRFKQSTGLAPHQYLIHCRINRAKELLRSRAGTIADIATMVGFFDQSHMSSHFRRIVGITPRRFMVSVSPDLPPHSPAAADQAHAPIHNSR